MIPNPILFIILNLGMIFFFLKNIEYFIINYIIGDGGLGFFFYLFIISCKIMVYYLQFNFNKLGIYVS